MEQYWAQSWAAVESFLPRLLIAIAIFVAGTVVAAAIAGAVRWALRYTKLDERLLGWIGEEEGPGQQLRSETTVAWLVFLVLEAYVLVFTFDQVGLTTVAAPLDRALAAIVIFLPRLLVAVLILAVAILIGRGLEALTRKLLANVSFDERVQKYSAGPERETALRETPSAEGPYVGRASPSAETEAAYTAAPGAAPVKPVRAVRDESRPSRMLARAVFWLTMLLALPLVLDALQLRGLLNPLQTLVERVLAFLPNLLLAVLVLVIGYAVARFVRQITVNLSASAGADTAARRMGLRGVGRTSFSQLLGYVAYVLVLIPVIIAALQTLELDALTAPAQLMLERFLAAIPNLFAAVVLLVIAWWVGTLLRDVAANLLHGLNFDGLLGRIGGSPAAPVGKRPSEVVGTVVLIAVMLLAAQAALQLLGFDRLADLVQQFLYFLGNAVLGLAIIALGIYLAGIAARMIMASGLPQAALLATLARLAIIVMAITMGLHEIGVGRDVIAIAFGAVAFGLALAIGLAFGLGGRAAAAEQVERMGSLFAAENGRTPGEHAPH